MTDIGYLAWDLAKEHGNAPCVRDDQVELTYIEFAERTEAVAAQLAGEGIGAGDVVAIMLPNRVELLIAIMAAWRLGAAATPVNPMYTANEADYQISDSGARLVITGGPDAPNGGCPTLCVDDLAESSPDLALPGIELTADDLALLIYTSGSTGRPKGVMLTHANLQFMASSMGQSIGVTGADHCLLILPLFHVNAICVSVLTPLIVGGQVSITGKFSVSRFFDDVARLRPTYFSAVPAIYAMLTSQSEDASIDTSSLRFAVCGAAPISKELLERAEARFGFEIVEGYGLTEGTCASACNPVGGIRKLGTVGPSLPGQKIEILSEDGTFAPIGVRGEVVIKGGNVMHGYLNRPDETAKTVVDGWLHTGDVGVLDEDGYLTLVDRIKDMIIRGGENIYPKEIENSLATHPSVLEAAVIGAPHDVYGEVPIAYVVAYPDAPVTEDELLDHVTALLTRVKVPVAIYVVDALPRNPVGKVDKPGMRRALSATPAR
ncbi:class I adenylate-forming enzyme family protein [Rhodococcus sp. ARC_M6]|uniref:class I adenylate-forming enzyme family protein n=1 Tax=Rhodococcus sp. ARC_M6 TaxID=2928852 RepID=UPI001FB3C187|nr:AMP-binding protein [Rhodococcus sp. ARC_M6]MCJ0907196.1 AMP-binding protein [Rhodococcus sp. ARC_M6]